MLALDPGDPSSSRPASVALQVFANGSPTVPDDIEMARARVDAPWPAGITLDQPPSYLGDSPLGGAKLARSASGFAVAWHRQNVGIGEPVLRLVDSSSWTAQPDVVVAPRSDALLALTPGGTYDAKSGTFGGTGYCIAWRNVGAPGIGPTQALVSVLDANGALVLGPAIADDGAIYPGSYVALAWTGTEYLVAVSFRRCGVADPLCAPSTLLVATLVASGDGGAASLAPVVTFETLDPTTYPGQPALAAFGDRVWLAWSEIPDADGGRPPRTIRAVALGPDGRPLGAPITVATSVPAISSLALSAGDPGVVLTWAESGDPTLAQNQPGSSRIAVHRLDLVGAPVDAFSIDATFVDTLGPPTSIPLAYPHGALLLWAGIAGTQSYADIAWVARLDCAP
jgi:hypothetical protein